MPSFEESLLNDFGEGFNKRAEAILNSTFLNNKTVWTNFVVDNYVKHNVDPNVSLTKLASHQSLNNEQIQRLVEEVNVNIYLQKYAQTKGKPVRRVLFPLADSDKIKHTESKIAEENVTNKETNGKMADKKDLEKAASTMVFDVPESTGPLGNFLTSTNDYAPSLWEKGSPEKVASTFVKRKIETKIDDLKQEKRALVEDLMKKISYIGESLIGFEKLGNSAQTLFEKIAADSEMYGYCQLPIIRYVQEKVAFLKENKRLPQNFIMDIHQAERTAQPYSLGKHSLLEKLGENIVIHIDKLPDNADYTKLVQVATQIKQELEKNPPKDTSKPIDIKGV